MKTVLFLLFLTSLYSFGNNLEWKRLRTWTNSKGEEMKASLESATNEEVRIRRDGKTFTIPISSLSEDDVKYVRQYLSVQPVRLKANSIEWTHPPNKKLDSRRVAVEVKDVVGRELKVTIAWLGDDGNKRHYGVYETETKSLNEDGELVFEIIYYNKKRKYDRNYRGFAVKVEGEGNRLGETASQVPFIRFLK